MQVWKSRQELCNLLWSAATLSFHEQEVLTALTMNLLDSNIINKFRILDLANACWALAKLQQDDLEIFGCLERQLVSCGLQDATPQQLSNLAWAFATVSFSDGVALERIAHEAENQIPQFSSQGLSNLVWALANQNVKCDAFFQAVGDQLISMDLERFDALAWAVDIAQIIKSFGDLTFCHPCIPWSRDALLRVGSDLDRRLLRRGMRALEPKEEAPEAPEAPEAQGTKRWDASDASSSKASKPKVLWEDSNRCVLLKPAGWQVDTEGTEEDFIDRTHAAREMLSQFMASNYTAAKYPILTDVKCKNGFLHRLDVPSSGLILVAKKYSAYFDLLLQLHSGEILRDYLVLVHGLAEREVVALRLAKEALTSWSGRQRAMNEGKVGKPSLSQLRVGGWATRNGGCLSFVAVRIGSGRRHQIRVHTAHIGHPTVSDGRYSTEQTFLEDQQWCHRNFLHRFSMCFKDSDGIRQRTICELPEDLCAAMWQLRPWGMQSAETMDLWQSMDTEPSPLTWEDMPLIQKNGNVLVGLLLVES